MSKRSVGLSFSTDDRGQFVTLGSILLALLIIGGVYIGYVGYTSYDDRRGGVSQAQDVTGPSDELADALSTTLMYANHNGEDVESEFEHTADAFEEQSGYEVESVSVDTTNMVVDSGERVSQTDPSENFTNNIDGEYINDGDLQIEGVDDHRQFTIKIIPDLIEEDVLDFEITTGETESVVVEFDRAGSSNFGNLEIEKEGEQCQIPIEDSSEPVEVDLLKGSVAHSTCYETPIDDPVTSVELSNAENIRGAFSSTFYDGGAGDSVYGVEVEVTTIQDGHSVTRDVYIAPGTPNREVVN